MGTKQVICSAFVGLSVFALLATPASAQSSGSRLPVTFDVVGGLNLATMTLPTTDLVGLFEPFEIHIDVSRRAGFVGGVLVGVPMGDAISFETGALLSVKGASMEVSVEGFGTSSGHLRVTYLDVPALVRFRVVTTPVGPVSLVVGPTVSVRLHAKSSVSAAGETSSESFTDEVTPIDLGATVGGRIEVGRGLIDVRYTHGLRNSARESETPVPGEPDPKIKHRVFSVMAGWRF